jgi:hypothetical protein
MYLRKIKANLSNIYHIPNADNVALCDQRQGYIKPGNIWMLVDEQPSYNYICGRCLRLRDNPPKPKVDKRKTDDLKRLEKWNNGQKT